MQACVYYDEKKEYILDISPRELEPEVRSRLQEAWKQPIQRKILVLLSQGVERLPDIQQRIGHSPSTLHAAVQRLTELGFVNYKMVYTGNKQKILSSNVLCVTRNPKSRMALQKFFQGLWIDSAKTKRIVKAMHADKRKWWTPEELSVKTKIPVDEIALLLSNFDSPTTKALSQFLKEPPFEKRVAYRAR